MENEETTKAAKAHNKSFNMAMLTTLSISDIVTASNAFAHISTHPEYAPPPDLQVLQAAASNEKCGPRLLTLILKDVKTRGNASKVLSTAAHNKVFYQECIDILLKYTAKITIDRSLVNALAEQPNGKVCLKKILGAGKEIEFDEWEKGYVINVVRESFGHAILGEMIDKLGSVVWQSCNDRRYCGPC